MKSKLKLTNKEKSYLDKLKKDFESNISYIKNVETELVSDDTNNYTLSYSYKPHHHNNLYADRKHNHDTSYSPISHLHNQYALNIHPHPLIEDNLNEVANSIRSLEQSCISEGDSRLTDHRNPTPHASSHIVGNDKLPLATESSRGLATPAQIKLLYDLKTKIDKLLLPFMQSFTPGTSGFTGYVKLNDNEQLYVENGLIKEAWDLTIQGSIVTPNSIDFEDGSVIYFEDGSIMELEAA